MVVCLRLEVCVCLLIHVESVLGVLAEAVRLFFLRTLRHVLAGGLGVPL